MGSYAIQRPPISEKGQTLSILENYHLSLNITQGEEFCQIECRTLWELCDEFSIYKDNNDNDNDGDGLAKRINRVMIQLKSKHKGFPVILFLDEIQAFGNAEGSNWHDLHPPGSSNTCPELKCAVTGPKDILNLIIAFNPGTLAMFHKDMRTTQDLPSHEKLF